MKRIEDEKSLLEGNEIKKTNTPKGFAESIQVNFMYYLMMLFQNVLARKNKAHAWQPGYNEKYDIIVISKDGTIGDIYFINNLKIALPSTPKLTSNKKKEDQYWQPTDYPKELKRIQTIFQWYDAPLQFLKING